MRISHIITDHNITVNYAGQTHIVPRDSKLADELLEALRNKETDKIPELISNSKRIETLSKGVFVVKDGMVYVNGVLVPSQLGQKIMKFSNENLPFDSLVKFAQNLQQNPSFRSVNQLFDFLEKNDHPITDDGNFIAYKRVRSDFMDIHSGTFDNSVGNTVEMPRNEVDDNPHSVCSNGLHVANWNYAHTQFSSSNPATDVMLEVEVNPADVVSVPVDYNNSKMRVCKYVVLGVVDKEHSSDLVIRHTSDIVYGNDEIKYSSDEDEEGDDTYSIYDDNDEEE